MKTLAISAVIGALLAIPAIAQTLTPAQAQAQQEQQLRSTAAQVGVMKIEPSWGRAPGEGVATIPESKDPWRAVTVQQMAAAVKGDPYLMKRNYSLQVAVDFNADGKPDVARIVNNSRQGAVIVYLGGGGAPVVAYKQNGQLLGGEEIVVAGKNRILLNVPGVNSHLLFMRGGKPQVITYGE